MDTGVVLFYVEPLTWRAISTRRPGKAKKKTESQSLYVVILAYGYFQVVVVFFRNWT